MGWAGAVCAVSAGSGEVVGCVVGVYGDVNFVECMFVRTGVVKVCKCMDYLLTHTSDRSNT